MKIIETRTINIDRIRQLCIEKNFYTMGTNEEYSEMLSYAESLTNVTTEDLKTIALDIFDHSNTDHYITDIMWELNENACFTYFETV